MSQKEDLAVPPPPPASPVPPPPPIVPAPAGHRRRERSGWKIASIIIGSLLALFSLGLLAAGGATMWADRAARDGQGFLSASHDYRTPSYALVVNTIDLGDRNVPSFVLPSKWLGTVRIRVASATPGVPVFVGIARDLAARRYLHGVRYSQINDFGRTAVPISGGSRAPRLAPTDANIWSVSSSGRGPQTVRWKAQTGTWAVVVMNADGRAGVDVTATAGATVPVLIWVASGLLIAGGVFLAIAILLIVLGVRQPKRRPELAG